MKIPFQLNVLYFDKSLRPLKLHGSGFQKSDEGTSFRQRFPLHHSLILVGNNQTHFHCYLVILKCLIWMTVVLSICTVFSSDFLSRLWGRVLAAARWREKPMKQNISAIPVHPFTLQTHLNWTRSRCLLLFCYLYLLKLAF